MIKHLSKLNTGSKLTFSPPTHCDDWLPFVDGHNWLRLFTDGGQSIPDSHQGVAVCGYAILAGPFKNHNPSTISDSDGTLIYKGGAFLGMGNVLTNNDAEYAGLYLGLKKCLELGTNRVHHPPDSGMVIGIENGNTPRQENIRRAHRRTGLLKQIIYGSDGDIVHTHIYRNRNEIADAEGHIAEDKKPPPHATGLYKSTRPTHRYHLGMVRHSSGLPHPC
jgi:ribonuclease HI